MDEYHGFLAIFDQNVLVTFGTTFMPNEQLCELLVSTFKQFKNVGFIVSIKDNEEINSHSIVSKLVEQKKLSNVLLKNFLPQRNLLNSKKINLFITHCGANSVFESVYFGKTMIGLPQTLDQIGNSYKIDRL